MQWNLAVHVGPANTSRIQDMEKEIMTMGVKYKDEFHAASAILAQCDYFISTDKRLLKYRSDKIKLVNPVEFVSEVEEFLRLTNLALTQTGSCGIVNKRVEKTRQQAEYPLSPYGNRASKR